MEIKKSPKADLQSKRRTFFLVGLIVALAIMIGLFSWSQSTKVIDNIDIQGDIVEQDVVDVTVQDQKPVEPPKVEPTMISDIMKIVKNDAKIEGKIDFFDDMDLGDLTDLKVKSFSSSTKEEAVEEDIPVFSAEENPMFQGKDINAFRKWCGDNLVYPQIAAENGIQGRVLMSFVVERDGSISNVKVVRSADRELDAAAVKIISSSPKWTPGKNRGKPVRFFYNMPVDFVLQQ